MTAEWLCPLEHRPPLGEKINLLTHVGIPVIGMWDWKGGYIAWAPKILVPGPIKDRIGRMPDWHVLDVERREAYSETVAREQQVLADSTSMQLSLEN